MYGLFYKRTPPNLVLAIKHKDIFLLKSCGRNFSLQNSYVEVSHDFVLDKKLKLSLRSQLPHTQKVPINANKKL